MTRARHSYRGSSVAERQEERRELFLAAGLEVFATKSYAGSSLTDVCAAAGLSRRQFYELFSGREELLVAVYDQVQGQAREAVVAALSAVPDAALPSLIEIAGRAYIEAITADRRRVQVAFVEIVGVSPAVERHRAGVRDEWGQVVAAIAAGRPEVVTPPGGWPLAMAAFVGAVNGAVQQWSADESRPPVEALVAIFARMLTALTAD
ncbi:TetR/AcrR family transcriptional regulator [Nocardia camponoti]|uniref:TetR family transcriptional regulator n=1 Tax=Nocardia camponoti TaxID=1616106 RepID=A0A917QT76_9NOCA|nr:TetR/AcrR family transcriptional regulator [Nocardia camponoti]GGK67397.1 TetR family transcriptional regulator [Nocardia camponoti]